MSFNNSKYRRTHKELVKELLSISDVSYYRWKKDRPIFKLLEKYFSNEELEEFLKDGRIDRLEPNHVSKEEFDKLLRRVEHLENTIEKDTHAKNQQESLSGK